MNTVGWILQGILTSIFLMAGSLKILQSEDKLNAMMAWTTRYPSSTVKLIGFVEILGAIGLILPLYYNIMPVLTPLSATGLAIIMVLAFLHHSKHNEKKERVINFVIFIDAAFIAYLRFGEIL